MPRHFEQPVTHILQAICLSAEGGADSAPGCRAITRETPLKRAAAMNRKPAERVNAHFVPIAFPACGWVASVCGCCRLAAEEAIKDLQTDFHAFGNARL
jgi:hypothetical protein